MYSVGYSEHFNLWNYFSIKIWKSIISLSLSLSGTPIISMLDGWMLSHGSMHIVLFLTLCFSVGVVSICGCLCALILFYPTSNLMWTPSSIYIIYRTLYLLFGVLVLITDFSSVLIHIISILLNCMLARYTLPIFAFSFPLKSCWILFCQAVILAKARFCYFQIVCLFFKAWFLKLLVIK